MNIISSFIIFTWVRSKKNFTVLSILSILYRASVLYMECRTAVGKYSTVGSYECQNLIKGEINHRPHKQHISKQHNVVLNVIHCFHSLLASLLFNQKHMKDAGRHSLLPVR